MTDGDSQPETTDEGVAPTSDTRHGTRLLRGVFGDRLGIIVFLTALVVYLALWRVGALLNDTYTVANTLVAVSDGQFHVERAVYGPGLETPGMGTRDGLAYGRNYGQAFLALPFLLAIEALAVVSELRVALAALWALAVLGLVILVGWELGYPEYGAYAGSLLALVGFAAAIVGATPVDPSDHYQMALEAQTILAAAFVGVVVYRLLARMYDRRVGFAAGFAATLATPVGFWASFPKRHVAVAFAAVAVMYLLYRSREGDGIDTRFRAAAYVPVGLLAWVSAAEGAIMLVALLAVDVPTGGRNLRSLATAAAACVLASVPMFVTNLFVTGNPAEPPRTLTYGGGSLSDSGGGNGENTAEGGGSGSEAVDAAFGGMELLFDLYRTGVTIAFTELDRFYHTFVRGGYLPGIARLDAGEAIRLSFLESMPLAAGLVVVPLLAARADLRGRIRTAFDRRSLTAIGVVDAFVVVYTLGLTLVYLPRLPIHSAITVRFLLPVFPIVVYALARQSSTRRLLRERPELTGFSYAAGVFVGGQLLVVYLWHIDATRGEAVQVHALLGLLTAALLAGWVLVDGLGYREDRLGAVALGLAAAAGTVFVGLACLWHFAFVGPQAVPLG